MLLDYWNEMMNTTSAQIRQPMHMQLKGLLLTSMASSQSSCMPTAPPGTTRVSLVLTLYRAQ